jgi:hypothetical protein
VTRLAAIADSVDHLDAIVGFHLGDARVHLAWARDGVDFAANDVALKLREAYRASESVLRIMGWETSSAEGLADPQLLIEAPKGYCLVRRMGDNAIAIVFGAAAPLGMARLMASRIVRRLSTEQLFGRAELVDAPVAAADAPVRTLAYPPLAPPPVARRSAEAERTARVLAYAEAHAAEPHVARLRIALKAGLTPLALEHVDALSPEAIVLIETAVEDLLGVSLADIRRLQ